MVFIFAKIWIHGIFSTKNREALIVPPLEGKLYSHLKSRFENDFDCRVCILNGTENHIHLLFLLNSSHSIQEVFKNVKGESSHWINQQNLIQQKFSWQVGYGAFSVSESMVGTVEAYIKNQKNHHKKMSFQEEYELFLKKYGFVDLVNR